MNEKNEVDIVSTNKDMSSISLNGDNNNNNINNINRKESESKIVDLKSIIDNKRNSITGDKKRGSVTIDIKKKKDLIKKSTKIVKEKDDPRTSAICCVQRFFRYFLLRKAGRISICENLFRAAFISRTEESLTKALLQTNKWNMHSRLLRSYVKDAKILILDLGSESYIINELVDAIKSKSIEILTDAIKLAQESHLLYIPELREAQCALDEAYRLKNTLVSIFIFHSLIF
jgi:cell division protein FtsI/penicillin-binding protein 2